MDRNILHNMHVSFDNTAFAAGSAGDSSFQSQISGLANGTDAEKKAFINHFKPHITSLKCYLEYIS